MKHMRLAVYCCIWVSFFFSAPFLSPAFAQETNGTFLYVGFNLAYISNIQNSDFNGQTYFESENELFLVPLIKGTIGYEGLLGGRFDFGSSFLQAASIDIIYHTSSHKYAFMDAESNSTTASLTNFLFIIRTYFLPKNFIQPFAYVDIGFSILKVDNGSYSYTPPLQVGAARYSGIDAGLGAGAEFRLPAGFSLQFSAGYHLLLMEDVKGVLGEKYNIDKIKSWYPRLTAGIIYYFRLK